MLLPVRCERVATSLNRTQSFELVYAPVTRRKNVFRWSNGLISFLVKLGKTFTEAYSMLQEVYGNECLFRTQVFEWFKRFKEGRETTEDDPRPGPPSMSKTDEDIEIIVLTPEQKESRMNIRTDILNDIDTDPGLLDTVITCDDKIRKCRSD
ncbi:hypothetical protein NQ318_014877 [Aromia moschata]|uniref:Mos1 transposase HTH domain-containing protein n=1 Tax=Aromia moschata TaxID=1265417 RepID=A0AAV8YTE4_9CUCU|nr:hypothetical protein NQ318_014877 [Aromia moschata]